MNAIYSDYSPIFLYVDKYRFSKNWGYPGATVPYSLIRYVISGRAVFSLGDTSYDVGPDDVFYIPQGSVLSCAAKEEIAFISIRFVGSVQLADTVYICIPYLVPEDVVLRAYFIADTIFAKDAGEAYTALENADNLFNMPDELAADYRRFLEKHSENIGVLIKCPPAEEMEDLHVHIGTDSFSFECLIAAKCNDDDAIDRFQQRMSDIKASFLEMADNKRAKCNW